VGGWVDLSSGPSGTTLILSIPLDNGGGLGAHDDDALQDHDPSAWGDL
jgi:hypothetical protein